MLASSNFLRGNKTDDIASNLSLINALSLCGIYLITFRYALSAISGATAPVLSAAKISPENLLIKLLNCKLSSTFALVANENLRRFSKSLMATPSLFANLATALTIESSPISISANKTPYKACKFALSMSITFL